MFYNIKSSGTRTYWYVWNDLSNKGLNKKICNCCGRNIYFDIYQPERHCLAVEGGGRCPDLHIICDSPRFPIFSEKAVNIFTQHCISGFRVEEQVILFKQVPGGAFVELKDIPNYYKVTFEGKVDFDYPAMFLKKKKICAACGQYDLNRQRLYPVFLNSESWDGKDMCSLITCPKELYCTEKVAQLAKKYKLKGFDFRAVQEK